MSQCQCSLRVKLIGDGCRYCNPQDYIDHLHDALEQKDTWVGLTDEEVITISRYDLEYAALIGEVQRRLKEKNT